MNTMEELRDLEGACCPHCDGSGVEHEHHMHDPSSHNGMRTVRTLKPCPYCGEGGEE